MRAPPCWPNDFPEVPVIKALTLELWVQWVNLGRTKISPTRKKHAFLSWFAFWFEVCCHQLHFGDIFPVNHLARFCSGGVSPVWWTHACNKHSSAGSRYKICSFICIPGLSHRHGLWDVHTTIFCLASLNLYLKGTICPRPLDKTMYRLIIIYRYLGNPRFYGHVSQTEAPISHSEHKHKWLP